MLSLFWLDITLKESKNRWFILLTSLLVLLFLGEFNLDTADQWLSQYLDSEVEQSYETHQKISLAMLRMYRDAFLEDRDVGPAFALEKNVADDVTRPLWALCGSSARFYKHVAELYGYQVDLVEAIYVCRPGIYAAHILVEVSGNGLSDSILYDPLYGVYFKIDGENIGLRQYFGDIGQVYTEKVEPYYEANSYGYERVNALDYDSRILRVYFNSVVMRSKNVGDWIALTVNPSKVETAAMYEKFTDRNIAIFELQENTTYKK